MVDNLIQLLAEEDGQGTTEYSLVLGVIAVGVIGIVLALKLEVYNIYEKSVQVIEQAARSVGLLN
jgi:pilus assembly protein Flp/PilA